LKLTVAQDATIRSLSTPIIEIWDGVLAVPLIGALGGDRAADIMQSLLERIVRTRSRHALIDLTGVDAVDSETAERLVRILRAIATIGARGIITGIHPKVAQTMTSLGLDLRGLTTCGSLKDGLRMCMR